MFASLQDKFGLSAADVAAEAGHSELAALLKGLMKTDADLMLEAKRARNVGAVARAAAAAKARSPRASDNAAQDKPI